MPGFSPSAPGPNYKNLQDLQRDTGLAFSQAVDGCTLLIIRHGHNQPRKTTTNMELDFIHHCPEGRRDRVDSGVVLNPFMGVQHSYKVMSSDIPLIDPGGGAKRQDATMSPMQTGKLLQPDDRRLPLLLEKHPKVL